MTAQLFSTADVANHNTKSDLWVVIHNKVYDITKFVQEVKRLQRRNPEKG